MRSEAGPRPTRTAWLKKKQTGARKGRVVVPRNKLGFPQSMSTTLRYVERVEFNLTDQNIIAWTFRGNGIFDPLYNAGGHQPRGFDQYMALYKTFTVTGCNVKANFMHEYNDGPSTIADGVYNNMVKEVGYDGSNQVPALSAAVVGIQKSAKAVVSQHIGPTIEQDKTTHRTLCGNNPTGVTTSMSGTTKEFFGKEAAIGAEGYAGTAAEDPDQEYLFHVWAGRVSDNFAADSLHLVAYVTCEYKVTFTEPVVLAAS